MTNKTKKVISKREKLFLNWMARPVVDGTVNPNYKPEIDPPSYKKDNLQPGEFNPKDIGVDGYEYHDDILEDYKPAGGSDASF